MKTEQEVIYFEPNSLDFNVEDLSVGIYFEVEVPQRGLVDAETYTGSTTMTYKNDILGGTDGLLTTSYTDITLLELENGGNKESIGIESITIKYNSWYFPEVNVKFVDVRGNSVFNPNENVNDPQRTAKPSFFNSLFMFPYPVFKLTIKGYYGKPVTFKLTVSDMRATFNSKTGNFEISVDFMGFMYSYMTDIPMRYLLLAPNIKYQGEDSYLGKFSDDGKDIPSYTKYLQQMSEVLSKMEGDKEYSNNNKEIEKYRSATSYAAEMLRKYTGLKDCLDKNFSISPSWDEQKTNKVAILYNTSADNDINTVVNIIRDSIKGFKEYYSKINDAILYTDEFTILENDETEISNRSFYDSTGTKTVYHQLTMNYNSDIEKLNALTDYISKKLKALEDTRRTVEKNYYSEIVGWVPTVKNMIEMTIAHLNKFHANMERCLNSVRSNSSKRTLKQITTHSTDCNSNSDNITVFPFPSFFDNENQYTWIGDVPAAANYDERFLVENIVTATRVTSTEMDDAFTRYNNLLETSEVFPQYGIIPTLLYDLIKPNPYTLDTSNNLGSKENADDIPLGMKIFLKRLVMRKMFNNGEKASFDPRLFGNIEAVNMLNRNFNPETFSDPIWFNGTAPGEKALEKASNYLYKFVMNNTKSYNRFETGSICDADYKMDEAGVNSNSSEVSPYCEYVVGDGRIDSNFNDTIRKGSVDWLNPEEYDRRMRGVTNYLHQLDLPNAIDTYANVFPSSSVNVKKINPNVVIDKGFLLLKDGSTDITYNDIKNNKDSITYKASGSLSGEEKYNNILSMFFENTSWINNIIDFCPSFVLDENDRTFFDSYYVKTGFFRKEGKCSFSCKSYYVGTWGDTSINQEEWIKISETMMGDFFTSLGFEFTPTTNFQMNGINKVPMLLLMYIGHKMKYLQKYQPSDYAFYHKSPILEYAETYYNENLLRVAGIIANRIVSPASVVTEEQNSELISELKIVAKKDNQLKGWYAYRVLNEDAKNALRTLFSEEITIFNLKGNYPESTFMKEELTFEKNVYKFVGEKDVATHPALSNFFELKEALTAFCEVVAVKCGLYKKGEEAPAPETTNDEVSTDLKLNIYSALKNVYDRWKFGTLRDKGVAKESQNALITIDNFSFRDSLNNDISKSLNIDPKKVVKLIESIMSGEKDTSVYSFIFSLCSFADCMLMTLPINIYDAVSSAEKMAEIFTPYHYFTGKNDDLQTSFIVTYTHKPSQHLNFSSNESGYKDDGIDFVNGIVKSDNTNTSNLGVFGVTYALGNQRFFKDISTGMDKPKVTEQSIMSMMNIADSGSSDKSKSVGIVTHDLFDTYSNHSYTCTVEMMGCAQIMPMMYFQLNNIGMFKGGYMIVNTEHSISNQGMTTRFTGVRLSKNKFNLNHSQQFEFAVSIGAEDGENLTNISETINGLLVSEGSTTLGKKRSNAEKLTYTKEKTLIVIDAGHNVNINGKESPLAYGESSIRTATEPTEFDSPDNSGIFEPLRPQNDTYVESLRYREYWGNRKIADTLYEKLKYNGYNVQKLYSSDRTAGDYSNFTAQANRLYDEQKAKGGSMIIISIHSNAASDSGWSTANYWSIYKQSSEYVAKQNKTYHALHPETSHFLAQCIAQSAKEHFTNGANRDLVPYGIDVHTEPKTFEDRKTDSGIRPTTFCKAPTVLSENMFHDNKEHVKFMGNKKGRDLIANLHYDGIERFFEKIKN